MLIGHLAVAILEHRYLGTEFVPTLAGTLFPDAVDKTLCQVFHVTPNGRMWAHTLLSLAASTSLVRLLAGEKTAYAWAMGYAGHFLADSPETLPLAYPFKTYTFTPSPGFREIFHRFFEQRGKVALELGMLILALVTLALPAERRRG
jgi:hypothetical protein